MIAAAFFALLLTWSSASDKSNAVGVGVQGFTVPFVALPSISRKLPATTTTTTTTDWSLALYNTDENTNAETNNNQDANRDVHLDKGVNNDEPGPETEDPQANPPEETISKATSQESEVIIMKMLEQMRFDMANEKVEMAAERKALEVKVEALEAEREVEKVEREALEVKMAAERKALEVTMEAERKALEVKMEAERKALEVKVEALEVEREALEVKIRAANLEKTKSNARPIFDMKALVKTPLDVRLPDKPESPTFVCSKDWLNVKDTIMMQLEANDTRNNRVPPIALVRCSRGGKTRALTEIAHILQNEKSKIDPVAVIFVSFNDITNLSEEEENGPPLQALLRRMAFAACRDQDKHDFDEFCARGEDFDESLFAQWLGNGRIVLIIDELNNLPCLTLKTRKSESRLFGDFLKQHFLRKKGRYLLFSSHVLSTIRRFKEFLDPGSSRGVLLQELPLITNLNADFVHLKASSLNGARAAIYYGRIPALIYEAARGNLIEGKRDIALEQFLSKPTDRTRDFVGILRSLINGDLDQVPPLLHILLDSSRDQPSENKVRWVPYHLEFVLKKMQAHLPEHTRVLAAAMASQCSQLLAAKECSGESWEGLFVLLLLVRSIAALPDDNLLPKAWFGYKSVIVEYNPYKNPKRQFSKCTNWAQIKEGMILYKNPTISIFKPWHAQFKTYDAIVVYSENKKLEYVYGYQLKEGKAKTRQHVDETFHQSFVIKGLPSNYSIETDAGGWSIPSKEVIDTFFGVSGKHWTPQAWASLTKQVDEMALNKEPSIAPVRLNKVIKSAGARAITGKPNQELQSKNLPQGAAQEASSAPSPKKAKSKTKNATNSARKNTD